MKRYSTSLVIREVKPQNDTTAHLLEWLKNYISNTAKDAKWLEVITVLLGVQKTIKDKYCY